MLSFGKLVQERNHIQSCMFQQSKPCSGISHSFEVATVLLVFTQTAFGRVLHGEGNDE